MTAGRGEGRLLLVGMGMMGTPYVRAAHERGWRVTVLETASGASVGPAGDLLREDDALIVVPGSTEEHWHAAAATVGGAFSAVLAFSEPQVLAASAVADQLHLPGPGLRAALLSRNKAYQRAAFARHGLPQPEHGLFDAGTVEQARAWAAGRFPVVGKPVDGTGSLGVRILADHTDLDEWLASRDRTRPYLLEEFVDGQEFSVEGLVHRGAVVFTNVTRKRTTEPPYCVEVEHQAPADLPPRLHQRLTDLLAAAVETLGCQSCLVHLEARVRDGEPYVLEIAVRTPGDFLMEVVGLAHGLDLFAAALSLAAGERPAPPSGPTRAAAVWFPIAGPGRVVEVRGLDRVRDEPGVELARMWAGVGKVTSPVRSSLDRLGAVVVSAADVPECQRRIARVKELLQVEVEPPTGVLEAG